MMPYVITLKVRKFHRPTANRFGTAPLPPPPSLNRVNTRKLILFLEYNLDLSHFAPPLTSLLFGEVFGTWFLINFGLLSAKICPGPVYSQNLILPRARSWIQFVLTDPRLADQVYSEYLILPQFGVVLC